MVEGHWGRCGSHDIQGKKYRLAGQPNSGSPEHHNKNKDMRMDFSENSEPGSDWSYVKHHLFFKWIVFSQLYYFSYVLLVSSNSRILNKPHQFLWGLRLPGSSSCCEFSVHNRNKWIWPNFEHPLTAGPHTQCYLRFSTFSICFYSFPLMS